MIYLQSYSRYFLRERWVLKEMKIDLNNRLEVIWKEKIYKSIIQDKYDTGFLISIPMIENEYLPASLGEVLEIINYQRDGEIYQFTSTVLNRVAEKNLPCLFMSMPKEIKRVQRRNYVRVSTNQIIRYSKGNNKSHIDLNKKAILMDLSGGGMRVKIKEKVNAGESITATITYKNKDILVSGQVVRIIRASDGDMVYGITFNELSDYTRENIIKIVFDIMRKQRELL